MVNLLASLGLGDVSADVNSLPDNRYAGIVSRSEYVVVPAKNNKPATLSHVITYKVTDGDMKGREKAEWFRLGIDPVDANGNVPERASEVTSYTPTMTDNAKTWYKKRWVDCGVPEEAIPGADLNLLVGKPIIFGTKTENGYSNVKYVEKRSLTAMETPTSLGSTPTDAPVGQAAPTGDLLGDL